MNYLAHLFLSGDSIEMMVGNFITDQITIKEAKTMSGQIAQGIELHREIDSFTDAHPTVKEFIKHVRSHQSKYAPVVVDIYSDYLLFQEWDQYSPRPFDSFSNSVYENIPQYLNQIPPRIHPRVQSMVNSKWLAVYTSLEGMIHTFDRLQRRVRFQNNLQKAPDFLDEYKEVYRAYFNDFFPDVINHVKKNL